MVSLWLLITLIITLYVTVLVIIINITSKIGSNNVTFKSNKNTNNFHVTIKNTNDFIPNSRKKYTCKFF